MTILEACENMKTLKSEHMSVMCSHRNVYMGTWKQHIYGNVGTTWHGVNERMWYDKSIFHPLQLSRSSKQLPV